MSLENTVVTSQSHGDVESMLAHAKRRQLFWNVIKFASFGLAISFGLTRELWAMTFESFAMTKMQGIMMAGVLLAISAFGMIKGMKRSEEAEDDIADTVELMRNARVTGDSVAPQQ